MANAKKPAKAKTTSKKPAAKKGELMPKDSGPIEFTATEQKNLEMIRKDVDKLRAKGLEALKIWIDIGDRVNKLKDAVTEKYGRSWKAWAEENMEELCGFKYTQGTRYMTISKDQALLEGETPESVEEAKNIIKFKQMTPEKQAEQQAKAEEKAKAKSAPAPAKDLAPEDILMHTKTIEAVENCTDLAVLKELRGLIQERIDALSGDTLDQQEAEEAELEAADVDEAIADVIG